MNTYELNDDEDYKLPSGKELAKILNVSNSTIIQLLKKLYQYLLFDFMHNPLEVNNCKQRVMIYIPFDEKNPAIRKKDPNHYHKFFTYIQLHLSHIPRIGEEIRINILEHNNLITNGYVHRIEHSIIGKTQVILIELHPFDNDFARWEKLKEKYEEEKRWKEYLKRQE